MKLLITGGCGFLGANLASAALKKNAQLTIIDNLSRRGSTQNLSWLKQQGSFKFFSTDLRNSHDLQEIIKTIRPEVIFHLAGQVAMTSSIKNPQIDFEINVCGSINLLEAVRKFSPASMIIYASTNKVYGQLADINLREIGQRYTVPKYPDGFGEGLKLDFHSPYGCSKGAADQYMLDYARIFGIKTVVFRHSSIYGGRQFATCEQGWVGWFCQQALAIKNGLSDQPIIISGSGKQVRDILYVTDLNNLYFSAVEKSEQIRGQVFNIGGGKYNSFSLLELFTYLGSLLGITIKYQPTNWRISDQKFFVADTSKAKKILAWEPQVNKYQGVKKMTEWLISSEREAD